MTTPTRKIEGAGAKTPLRALEPLEAEAGEDTTAVMRGSSAHSSTPDAGMAAPRADPVQVEPSSRLRSLERIALEIGDEEVARDARDLASRVEEGRFHVACVGQFKRGKSTLLNAIVGAPVLPMGIAPVTSAITVLRHGETPTARVSFEDGRSAEVAVGISAGTSRSRRTPRTRRACARSTSSSA